MGNYEDQLDAPQAEAWMPAEDGVQDKLIGVVVDRDTRDSDYGEPYTILVIEQDDGTQLAWHAFHTVSRREIANKQPQIGDKVGVKYIGISTKKKPGQSPATIYRFKVFERGAYGAAIEQAAIQRAAQQPEATAEEQEAVDFAAFKAQQEKVSPERPVVEAVAANAVNVEDDPDF